MDQALPTLRNTLRTSGFSMTSSRRMIFSAIKQYGPLSVTALTKTLDETDRATVYRTVELFEKLGIVNRVWHGFKSTIELSEIFLPHHHHAHCQQCGATTDITSSELENLIAGIAKEKHFLALQHVVELQGYCKNCQ